MYESAGRVDGVESAGIALLLLVRYDSLFRRTPTMTPVSASPAPVSSPTLLTAAEFMARYENVRAELVKGVVKGMALP